MRGRQKTYKVELTDIESKQLQQLVAARKSPQSKAKRALLILTSAEHPDWADAQLAEAIGCSPALVRSLA